MPRPVSFTGYSAETPASYGKILNSPKMAKLPPEVRSEILSYLAEDAFEKALTVKGPDSQSQDAVERTATKADWESHNRPQKPLSHREIILHNLLCTLNPMSQSQTKQQHGFLRKSLKEDNMPVFQVLFKYLRKPVLPVLQDLTPLHRVAKAGHATSVKLLLDNGADLHAGNRFGDTPLHDAAKGGHEPTVTLLLEQGANPGATNQYGETPLHDAAKWEHPSIVKLLLGKGVNPDVADDDGLTPLHDAVKWGNEAMVRLLLDNGANPNARDRFGETPLHDVARGGKTAIAHMLLEKGADPKIAANDGLKPVSFARMTGHTDMEHLLHEHEHHNE